MSLRIVNASMALFRLCAQPGLSLALLALCTPPAAASRVDYRGCILAYPINQEVYFARKPAQPPTIERILPAILPVDSSGCVFPPIARDSADSALVATFNDYFRQLDFAPGLVSGIQKAQNLSIGIRVQPRVPFPIVLYPVDSTGQVAHPDLYLETLRQNGFDPPSLISFPWFHADLKPWDTSAVYRYVLLRVSLDSLGHPEEIETVRSTYPAFTQQIASAANYARYDPARVDGTPVRSDCLVLISFFPELSYPSQTWSADAPDTIPLLRRLLVRTVVDTNVLLSLPIPRLASTDELSVGGRIVPAMDSMSVRFEIDTLGRATFRQIQPYTGKLLEFAQALARQLRFYPAQKFDGSPIKYSGLARIRPSGVKTIRIDYLFMPFSEM
ncbi:MAG: hypothetical protein AB1644_10210 [Candidatus Zixiibacteriota bacterium]